MNKVKQTFQSLRNKVNAIRTLSKPKIALVLFFLTWLGFFKVVDYILGAADFTINAVGKGNEFLMDELCSILSAVLYNRDQSELQSEDLEEDLGDYENSMQSHYYQERDSSVGDSLKS